MYGNDTSLALTGLTSMGAIALSYGLMAFTVGIALLSVSFLLRPHKGVARP